MGTVINFPQIISNTGDASNYFKAAYRHAGLNENQIEFSLELLEPLIRKVLEQEPIEISIPTDLGFNSKQNDYILNLASSCKDKEWKMLCNAASIIAVSIHTNLT